MQPAGWSRGQFIGTTSSSNKIPVAYDPDGNLYTAFLSDQHEDRLRFISYDTQGTKRWELELPESSFDTGRSAELIVREGELLAFWLDENRVILQRMTTDGAFSGSPRSVSEGVFVSSFDVSQAEDGHLYLVYGGSTDEPGIYGEDLSKSSTHPVLIDPDGVLPDIAVDEYGILHAIWMTDPAQAQDAEIRYSTFLPGRIQRVTDPLVITTDFTTTDEIEAPSLGLDRYYAYIYWTVVIHTGLRAGQIDSLSVSFPLIDREQEHAARLFFPMAFDLNYTQAGSHSGLLEGNRLAWNDEEPGSDQARELVAGVSMKNETIAVYRSRVLTRSGQTQTQISAEYFEMGEVTGYQLLTFTNTASRHPNLLVDRDGYLYLTWLETTDVRQNSVYLATTAPSYRETFDRLTNGDLKSMGLDTLFGMVSGVILLPITFLWLILPMLSLGLTSFLRRNESSLFARGHIASLLIAAGLYWIIKLSIFPALRSTIPFVQWIPIIPAGWYPGLKVIVPLISTLIASAVAIGLVRRSDRSSPTMVFLIYGLLDGLLTVAVTGGALFGV